MGKKGRVTFLGPGFFSDTLRYEADAQKWLPAVCTLFSWLCTVMPNLDPHPSSPPLPIQHEPGEESAA
jgi:hypothetical protein